MLALVEGTKIKRSEIPGDSQKGRWGGIAIVNGKQLSAKVVKSEKLKGYFDVSIIVKKIDENASLESPVAVFVDESFRFQDNVILAEVNAQGDARATILAYEAFTVGALCLDGTELELDLNEVSGFPSNFYWK